MTFKTLLAAAALSTALTGAALAQTQTDPGMNPIEPGMTAPNGQLVPQEPDSDTTSSIGPSGWDDQTNDVFYTDRSAGSLRTQDEAMQRWSTLTPEQQARVKQDCEGARAPSNGGEPGLAKLCAWVNTM